MRYLYLLLSLLVFYQCSEEAITSKKIIEVNLNPYKSSELPEIKVESIFPLETLDTSVIGFITGVEIIGNEYFIMDVFQSRGIFKFSENGRFIRKTKNGKGPGELVNPFAFYADSKNEELHIWDQGLHSITKYDRNLNYLDQIKFGFPLLNFASIDENKTLVHTHYDQDFIYKLVENENLNVEAKFIPDYNYSGTAGIFRSISIGKENLLIAPFRYHIYNYKNNNLTSDYFIDFGKQKIKRGDIKRLGMSGVQNLIEKGERVSGLNNISHTSSYISFKVYYQSSELNFIYSIFKDKLFMLNKYFMEELPVCTVWGIKEDNTFYASVEPADLDEFQRKTGIRLYKSQIDYYVNPFIITFKFKD